MTTTAPLLHDQVAWNGKKLVVTDDSLIDNKLRRKALSASTSKSMQSCAARWVGERLLRNEEIEDPFAPAPLGSSAHSVLEDFYELPPHLRTLPAVEKILATKAKEMWPDDENAADTVRAAVRVAKRRWVDEVKAAYEGIFVIEDPKEVEVHSREMQIDGLEIEGVPTNGFIDRVEYETVDGVRGLVAADYKSGKVLNTRFGDDHGDQLRIYSEALRVKTGIMPVKAKVLYTKFGKVRDIDLKPTAMRKTLKTFALSWKRHNRYMDAAEFPTKESALCGWCPLVNSCPVAHTAGRVPRVEGLPTATDLGIPSLRPGAAQPQPEPAADTVYAHGDDVTFYAPDEDAELPAEEVAAVESAARAAAHMNSSGENPTDHPKEDAMPVIKEEKPWEPYAGGELNPASYSSIAAFGIVELAVESLHTAGQQISRGNVTGLSATFHHVISRAQKAWTGSVSLQDGANTRMRGALRTTLKTLPLPFGQDAEAWDEWADIAVRRCRSITSTALALFSEPAEERPWESLAVSGGAAAAEPVLKAVPEPEPVQEQEEAPAPKAKPKAKSRAADLEFPDEEFDEPAA